VPGDPNRFWDIELSLLANPLVNLNFNDTRNVYRFVDGASGWNLDDHIAGSNNVLCDPAAAEVAECLIVGMELTRAGAQRITGLEAFMDAFGNDLDSPAIPLIKGVGFMGGDILLGGAGSDVLEGKNGDDIIDGDVWLNVQLRAVLNDGTVKLVDSPIDLVDDVFAAPQRLNPGNITIVRTLVTPANVPAPDCGAAAPKNCDTAMFLGPLSEYTIVRNARTGIVTVTDNGPAAGNPNILDGVDRLRNIEQLQFSDVTVPTANIGRISVPNVTGATSVAATDTINGSGLVPVATNANSTTIAIGIVISQTPLPGTSVTIGSVVSFLVSIGTLVPSVVGQTVSAANVTLAPANLTVGAVTNAASTTVPAGAIISQTPAAGSSAAPGSSVAVVVSLGRANIVPNVVGLPRAAAATAITDVGLTVGAITFVNSPTIAAGSIVSTTPAAGTQLTAGAAVAIRVSLGVDGLVLALGFDEPSGLAAIDSSPVATNGTGRATTHVAGKFGGALAFNGTTSWVTVPHITNSPLDLTNGMTVEAWVNPAAAAGWNTAVMKERAGGFSYALYSNDGSPSPDGFNLAAGYVHLTTQALDQAVRSLVAPPLNTWTHLAVTYDGTTERLFVNGTEVSTHSGLSGNMIVANGVLRIGGNNTAPGGEFFRGLIDEVRVYNRARTGAQITADMNTPIIR